MISKLTTKYFTLKQLKEFYIEGFKLEVGKINNYIPNILRENINSVNIPYVSQKRVDTEICDLERPVFYQVNRLMFGTMLQSYNLNISDSREYSLAMCFLSCC